MDCNNETRVFVYGTLISGERNHHIVERFVVAQTKAEVSGFEMYSLHHGAFPGIVKNDDPDAIVKGQLLYLSNSDEAMRKMDYLEGYDPSNPESSHYTRIEIPVMLATGQIQWAWIYCYNRNIVGDTEPIKDGDWLAYCVRRQDRERGMRQWMEENVEELMRTYLSKRHVYLARHAYHEIFDAKKHPPGQHMAVYDHFMQVAISVINDYDFQIDEKPGEVDDLTYEFMNG